jgi:hypothetical protein
MTSELICVAIMPDQNQRQHRPSIHKLAWHCMMGITLGLLFAGLLLHSGELQAKGLVDGPLSRIVALRFMLTAAFVFGIAATLTDGMFLVNDKQ